MVFNLTRISNISIFSIGTFTIFWLGLNSWISLKIILCLCITSVLHSTFTQDKTSPMCSLSKGFNWVYHVKVESMYASILNVVKDLRVPNLYQSVQSSKIPNNPVSYLLSQPLEAEAREEKIPQLLSNSHPSIFSFPSSFTFPQTWQKISPPAAPSYQIGALPPPPPHSL